MGELGRVTGDFNLLRFSGAPVGFVSDSFRESFEHRSDCGGQRRYRQTVAYFQ
jgi:hypothetical protein